MNVGGGRPPLRIRSLESVTLQLRAWNRRFGREDDIKVSINLSVVFAKLIPDLLIFSSSISVYLRRRLYSSREEELVIFANIIKFDREYVKSIFSSVSEILQEESIVEF